MRPTGVEFVEGAILGAVGVSGAATRILTGGEHGGKAAEMLRALGLKATFYSAEVGKEAPLNKLAIYVRLCSSFSDEAQS